MVVSGYAANNSRALERRRSSVSEYVFSQDEEENSGSTERKVSKMRGGGENLDYWYCNKVPRLDFTV